MYTRSPTSGGNRGVRVPRNYSGNAFSAPPSPPQEDPPVEEKNPLQDEPAAPVSESENTVPTSGIAPASKLFPFLGSHTGKLFGSFGTEELLLLGLILLLAGNEGSEDLLLLLVLLLLIQ